MPNESRGVQTLVDAQPAMLHVRALSAKGMSAKLMADRSGVNERTIRAYIQGWSWTSTRWHGAVKRPISRATTETAVRVLALRFEEEWNASLFQPAKLRGLRESKGLSRIVLGKVSGIAPETIQYWETGRNLPARRNKLDAVLAALDASWEDVSGPSEPEGEEPVDEYSMIFSEGTPDSEQDHIPDYPCCVCGGVFRSRLLLRTHPHPAKVKVSV